MKRYDCYINEMTLFASSNFLRSGLIIFWLNGFDFCKCLSAFSFVQSG